MSRSWLVVIASVSALAFGCSHEEKPPANQASARVIPLPSPKAAAPPRVAAEAPRAPSTTRRTAGDAIYFDFDSSVLRDDARPVLQEVAETVRNGGRSLVIEGNCDELGTVEYNLALGQHRAHAAQEYLEHMGVPGSHIATVSYGSQRPKYPGHDETAHAKNRRDDLVVR